MRSFVCLAVALVASVNADSPLLRTVRNAEGTRDMEFVVEEGAKVGMKVGDDETIYFNDFQGDIQKVGEGNINAISLGVDIGKAFVNNFTKDLISMAVKGEASDLKEVLASKLDLVKLTSACNLNTQYEEKASSGATLESFVAPVCKPLTACASDEFESAAPTSKSDRNCQKHKTCKSDEYLSVVGTPFSDNVCAKLTVCKNTEEESKKPSEKTDRMCSPKKPARCSDFIGSGNGIRKVVSLDPKDTAETIVDAVCLNDGTYLGGDGSSRVKAGKSCGTIRRWHQASADKAYWTFMNDTADPVLVYCDMNSCGNDAAIRSPRWGNRRKDFKNCGGWTMTFKMAGTDVCSGNGRGGSRDCYYFNRDNKKNLRDGQVFGKHTTIDRENAMSPSYSRQDFSDVMIRSISAGWRTTQDASARKWQSVGWRHPWTAQSLMEVAQGCRVRHDGELLTPNNIPTTRDIRHRIGQGINWNSRSLHDHYLPENPRTRFGFFGHDGGGCANNRDVVGCQFEYSGHSRHFIGMHLGNNDPDRPGGGWGSRITSFGAGAGYCSNGGSNDRYSMTGHWWGHGSNNMQARSSAIFVRNKEEMMI